MDDFEPEFRYPTRKDLEAIREYLDNETQYIVSENYYRNESSKKLRSYAVTIIAELVKGKNVDAIIPYMAMNYFDRYASKNSLQDLEGGDILQIVHLAAICCFILAAKMRTKSFSADQFLKEKLLRERYNHEKILRTEYRILDGLQWRSRPVTAFCFVDYYYPAFKGIKRRCINQIIVMTQGEPVFLRFRPSVIALCAFMAAVYKKHGRTFGEQEEAVSDCLCLLIDLLAKNEIKIDPEESGIEASSRKIVALPQRQLTTAETKATGEGEASEMVPVHIAEEEDEENQARQERGKAMVEEDITTIFRKLVDSDLDQRGEDMNKAREGTYQDVASKTSEIEQVDDEETQQRRDKGKEKMVAEKSDFEVDDNMWKNMWRSTWEIVQTKEVEEPYKPMNFELKWPIRELKLKELQQSSDSEDDGTERFIFCGCTIA